MKTARKYLLKKCFAMALAVSLTVTAFSDGAYTAVMRSSADRSDELNSAAEENESEINSTEADIEALEAKQKELDEQIKATEGDIDSEKENKQAIFEQIAVTEETLHKYAESISELETQIDKNEESIALKEAAVEAKKQEILDGMEQFKKRLRVMYIAGNDTYTDILVGSSDFYDMLMKIELIKRVARYDSNMIDDLIELKDQYEAEENELVAKKQQLEDSLGELQEKREKQKAQSEKLDELYEQSAATIDKLAADKLIYEKNRDAIIAEQEQFEADLQELYKQQEALKAAQAEEEARKKAEEEEAARKKAEEEEAARKKAEEEEAARKKAEEEEAARKAAEDNDDNGDDDDDDSSSDSSTDSYDDSDDDDDDSSSGSGSGGSSSGSGSAANAAYGYVDKSRFTWPVPGYYHISYGVGWRWGAYHKGIDIWSEGIRGHNIIAADSGTVILVSNTCPHDYGKSYSCGCGGGYGNYCIIDHGDGWWTLYGHSEGITVSQGQYVNKGDKLGTVGSTGYSTGPHLHFEVRKDGVALNPSDYV